ncbi:MAG: hypothetical protein ABIV47_22995, partial [Roseiflexaceae bacterium]
AWLSAAAARGTGTGNVRSDSEQPRARVDSDERRRTKVSTAGIRPSSFVLCSDIFKAWIYFQIPSPIPSAA